jgi:serine/threonine protein kinase
MHECPSDEQLERLAGGLPAPQEAETLRDHLACCSACREAYEEWRANLRFASTVKEALGDGSSLTPVSRSGGLQSLALPVETASIAGYEIQEEIHRGAQGIVCRAIQKSNGRPIALKLLQDNALTSEASRRRFDREIELARSLHHANIIRVCDSGITPAGVHYYAMEYVAGLPLHHYAWDHHLGLEGVLELFLSVCDAVNYAHQRGVIHRDLKPSNILVDASGIPRVLDFGLAKQTAMPAETVLSLTGQVFGTLPYMSPEQAMGRHDAVDIRTDVYALGVILYQILTGTFPYPVTGPLTEVLNHIAQTPPTPPRKAWTQEAGIHRAEQKGTQLFSSIRLAWPGSPPAEAVSDPCPIDEDVETILLKALAKDPQRRYPNVAMFTQDLARRLRGEPIEARREARFAVLTRALARYKAVAALAGTALLIIGLLAVALAWMYEAQRSEREKASADRARAIQAQAQLAVALLKLGDRAVDDGQEEEALGQYLAALAINEHLAAANLTDLEAQDRLAEGLLRLGDLSRRRDPARAAYYYRWLLQISEQLVAAEMSNPGYHQRVATARGRLEQMGIGTAPEPGSAAEPTRPGGQP